MLQNLHTHTLFCDGKDTPEEMTEKAIELKFDSIGFSSHAPTSAHTDWETKEFEKYIGKINSLKCAYEGRIKIYTGIELDYYSAGILPPCSLDYKIGSVHMAFKNGRQIDFDHSADETKKNIKEIFEGDSIAYSRLYYSLVADMPNILDYDIVGHFDVLTKFSERYPRLIDSESKHYKNAALEALHAVREKREIFEINTGAISRGHRTTPYPAPFILSEMRVLKCKLILTSDCHDKDYLTCGFDEAKEYIKLHGFDVLYYLTDDGFIGERI